MRLGYDVGRRHFVRFVRGSAAFPGQTALISFNILLFLILIAYAIFLGLHDSEPTTRTRYHAVPVAMSQLYYGRVHDYTAFREIAHNFQLVGPIEHFIAYWAIGTPANLEATYFWMADDRGLSDLIYIAFLLFGPSMESIFWAYMTLIAIALAGFLFAFSRNREALTLCGVVLIAMILFLPVFFRAPGLNFGEQSVHISETRLLEFLLAIPAVFWIATLTLRERITWAWMAGLAGQVVVLAFAMHMRSSVLWLVGTMALLAATYTMLGALARRDLRVIGAAALLLMVVPASLAAVSAYQRAMFHPEYLDERGPRTVWHNVLMGLTVSPEFRQSTGMAGVNDPEAVAAVLRYMEARNDPRRGPDWTQTDILNSLGGHGTFRAWRTYDLIAREVVFHEIMQQPFVALRHFFVDKPELIGSLISCNATLLVCRGQAVTYPGVRMDPFSLFSVGLVFALVVAARRSGRSESVLPISRPREVLLVIICFAILGLFPSVAFYPALTQVGGVILFLLFGIAFALYLLMDWLVERFWSPGKGG